MWETSILNPNRNPLDSWSNRDTDTWREIDTTDLMNPRENAEWENDLIDGYFGLAHEPDLEQ